VKQAVTLFKNMRNQISRFEVCLSFAIVALWKYRLFLTLALLIHFRGLFVVSGSVSCGVNQCRIYVYNIYRSYYVVIFIRDEFNIHTVPYSH